MLHTEFSAGSLQEPEGALEGPLIELSVFGAKCSPEQVAKAGASWLGVADRFEASTVDMPVGVDDLCSGHYSRLAHMTDSVVRGRVLFAKIKKKKTS